MLEKASHSSLVEGVIEQIEEAIVDRTFKPGEKLPSPEDLQESLGISRGTLREALRVLEQKGLIEIKPGVGGGAVVKTVSTEQMSQGLALLIRYQRVSLNHIAEFRDSVEGSVAALAAERATKEDIERLKGLLKEAHKHLGEGASHWDAFIRVDEQLHLALAHITDNPLYISIERIVHENIHRYYKKFLPWKENVMRENYQDLCDIVAALEDRDGARACALAKSHVHRFHQHMEEKRKKE
ncbi:MAG: FadR family transcriptional regulator [Desulfobacteraceae bacterium]|nr:FadR family transcriptional regulator [Desulfobacteraceae bacterium]